MNDAEVSIKFNNKITNEKKLEKYAETLTKINSVMAGLNTGVIKQIDSSASNIKQIDTDIKDMSDRVGIAFDVTAISKYASAIKRLGAGFVSLSKQSFDYLENFNLFQVAFKGNYNSAERFINKMSEMYGLDESWLTQTIGKFKQLTNAMSLTEEAGEKVSKLLTQMSLDISSLYNVDIERASSTLASAMAGQTKPIRGVAGADITQPTLQVTLDQLGIEKSVNQLSFAEKRLLIIISLTRQLNASIGDMGRTIESPSNQLRIMNEQWERLTRAVGNVFLKALSNILPYLNAILMVLTEIISIIATLFGYKAEDFDYFQKPAASAWDLDEGLKSAGSSAKKLKQGLRGFDKLNVITTPSSGGSGGGVGAGGINPQLMDAFNKAFDDYQNQLQNVKMKATEIRDKIMDWLGFTKHINEETEEVYFTLNKGLNRFKIIVGLIATLAGLKLLQGLKGIITGTSRLGRLLGTGGLYKALQEIIKAVKVLGFKNGLLYVFYDSKLYKGISSLTAGFTKLAASLGLTTGALSLIIAAVVALAAAFVHIYKTNDEFREKVDKLVETLKGSLLTVLDIIKDTLNTIWKEVLVPIWEEVIKPLAQLLIDILTPVFESFIDNLQFLLDKVLKPILPILKKVNEIYLKYLIMQIKVVITVLSDIIKIAKSLWDNIIKPVGEYLVEKFKNIIEKLKEIYKNWLEPIYTFLKAYIMLAIYEIKEAFDSLKKTWKEIKQSFKENWEEYIQPHIDKIKEAVNKLKKDWQDLKDKWKLPDLKVPKLPKIKLTITYDTKVGASKQAVYKALGLDGWPSLKFQSYAKGGLPPVGQMFVANERGPELVGSIGGQSFVANQNQVVDLLDRKLGKASSNPVNATFVIQVGSKEIAKQVINDLQDIAITNGKPIVIGN